MLSDQILIEQLKYVVAQADIPGLGERIAGKVRDNYRRGDLRFLVASDRLSCFDRVVTTIPFKGEVLTQLAVHWFECTRDIIESHLVDLPDPNVMVVRECEILPVEVVVRGYLAGSAWRDYQAGRDVSGVRFPAGMKAFQQLEQPILTPSTKAAVGAHDQPISEADIVATKIVSPSLWGQVREAALALFKRGGEEARKRGLLLADTKYEFGMCHGKLLLADEIHTLDSSRYWVQKSYHERIARGDSPEMLDKEPVRQWLLSQGFKGDGRIPEFSDLRRVEIARHYLDSYAAIVGERLEPHAGESMGRIVKNVARYLQ